MQILIESKVDMVLRDDEGCNALHIASEKGNVEAVKLIIGLNI